jgi:hypothetical protein
MASVAPSESSKPRPPRSATPTHRRLKCAGLGATVAARPTARDHVVRKLECLNDDVDGQTSERVLGVAADGEGQNRARRARLNGTWHDSEPSVCLVGHESRHIDDAIARKITAHDPPTFPRNPWSCTSQSVDVTRIGSVHDFDRCFGPQAIVPR